MRSYVVPFPGHVLIDRDYNQQELRILAHFEGGSLVRAYERDAWLDFHTNAQQMINEMLGKMYARQPVKTIGFGLLYGMGLGKLAIAIDDSVATAREIKAAYMKSFDGIKRMYQEMRARSVMNEPIRTLFGREYFCEDPRLVDGRWQTFDYKLLNVLIQGSAADVTKECIIRYDAMKHDDEHLLLSVHDELLASVPKRRVAGAMERMRQSMEFNPIDVPLLSEGSTGSDWWNLKTYDRRGERL